MKTHYTIVMKMDSLRVFLIKNKDTINHRYYKKTDDFKKSMKIKKEILNRIYKKQKNIG